MKQLIYFTSLLLIFSVSCRDTENSTSETNDSTIIEKNQNIQKIKEVDDTKLIIEGKDIWVRSEPINGDVVMKLNTGDECEILEISDEDQVRDMFDYWYKIKFEGKEGWVFGSQTNKKSREIHNIKPFEDYFGEIARLYVDRTQDLEAFSHQELPYVFLFNPGAYCAPSSEESFQRDVPVDINDKNIYSRKPKGDFCSGYPGEKSGFYYWKIKYDELPSYWDFEKPDGGAPTKIVLPEKYTNNSFIAVQVVTNEYHFAYMYFINIDLTWYLICVNHCDCSA